MKYIFAVIVFIIACSVAETMSPIEKIVAPKVDSAKVALGKRLFFDARLSDTNSISCGSCHKPEFGFADNLPLSPGIFGRKGNRNTPQIVNAFTQTHFFHDGRETSLEAQAKGPLNNPLEMGDISKVVPKLSKDSSYVRTFRALYKRDITIDLIVDAIAEFERSLVFNNSPYDRFVEGDSSALTEDQQIGMSLFFDKAKCADCHSGSNFTDNKFHNIGFYTDSTSDAGRFDHTKNREDLGKFKTPSLRNIAVTAPYFRDGRTQTLKEVIELYNKPNPMGEGLYKDSLIQAIHLSAEEVYQLTCFLHALTSKKQLMEHANKFVLEYVIKKQTYTREMFEKEYYLPLFHQKIAYFKATQDSLIDRVELDLLEKATREEEKDNVRIYIEKTYFSGMYKHLFEQGEHHIFNSSIQ